MRIELQDNQVPAGESPVFVEERPRAARGQRQSISPKADEGFRSQSRAEFCERRLMGSQLEPKAIAEQYSEPENENRLPAELGWGAFCRRSHVSRHQRAPARPHAELVRGEASQFGCIWCRDEAQAHLP